MRHVIRVGSLTLGLLLAVATAQAQQPRPGGFGGFGGGGGGQSLTATLLSNKALQDELKVPDDLREKFAKLQEGQRAKQQELATLGSDDEDQLTRLKAQVKMVEDRIAVMKGLSEEQHKRLAQIERQQMGLRAFQNEKIVRTLKLTDDQKEKAKALNEEFMQDQRELFSNGFGPETQQKLASLRDAAMDKAEESLTQGQRKQWKEMVGEKFDMAKLMPMRRPMNN